MTDKMILIADDDFDIAQTLSLRLKQLGFTTMSSPDAMHALYGATKIQPDLIIQDVNMPGGNGLAVCEMLASDPQNSKIPVIVHTGCSDEQTKRRCKDLGAHYVLKSPGAWDEIKEVVCSLFNVTLDPTIASSEEPTDSPVPEAASPLPAAGVNKYQTTIRGSSSPEVEVAEATVSADLVPAAQAVMERDAPSASAKNLKQPKVLCIDDDPDISSAIMLRLRPYGVDVQRAFDGMQGFWMALDIKPDVIILDMNMPDAKGNYLVGRFNDHSLLRNVPVILLTGMTNPATKRNMLSMGVKAYLEKPLDFDELLQELRRHVSLPEEPISME